MKNHCPVVGISCDTFSLKSHTFHGSGEKYINAVLSGAQAMPVLLPAIGAADVTDMGINLAESITVDSAGKSTDKMTNNDVVEAMLDSLQGLFLTGSTSNIEPYHYHENSFPGDQNDPKRDATTLPLIRSAIERDIPILAVCRGFQELNVALGGSLHQRLEEIPGMIDHEYDESLALEERYDYAHHVALVPGGLLSQLAGEGRAMVNSLHQQGINQLAEGLEVEATAPDGLVEAVRWGDHNRFVVGVQWHPEWQFGRNRLYSGLFKAFGDAIRERM